jgi:hypothetical protein
MLHLAALECLASYFDYQVMEADTDSLAFKVDRISFSDSFKDILRGMIETNEEQRFGLITLQETIGLATGRETLRAHRSSSLYDMFKIRPNKSCSK